jgi:hypothetical protein
VKFLIIKLKHDLANDTELALAKLEAEGLVGASATEVANLADLLFEIPQLHKSIRLEAPSPRIQDVFLRMPYPGKYQGLMFRDVDVDLGVLKSRMTYCRDLFAICSESETLRNLDSVGIDFRNSEILEASHRRIPLSNSIRLFELDDVETPWLLRVVVDHTFLECSDHVVRLANKLTDVDRLYSGAVNHLSSTFDRSFAASVSMGYKWIEDFIDDRRAPNAYASHSLFGLRGRFFPRMVRSLANILVPNAEQIVVDPFGGVGTLGVELSLLGIATRSYELNPLFSLVSRAKLRALSLSKSEEDMLEEIRDYAQKLRLGQMWAPESLERADIPKIPAQLARNIKVENLALMSQLKRQIDRVCSRDLAEVAYLSIAYYAKSMATKYSSSKILTSFWAHISKTLYLSKFMRKLYADGLCTRPVNAQFETADIKDLSKKETNASRLITSPPYSTAIDYVGNDAVAYYALGFGSHEQVERQMIGSSKLGWYKRSNGDLGELQNSVPPAARVCVDTLAQSNETKALCMMKYMADMSDAFRQVSTAMLPNGTATFIVGTSQNFRIAKKNLTLPLALATVQIAERYDLHLERQLEILLTKNNDGDIKNETVLFFRK